ncbi:alanine racemase [Candidatus Uhrbacteria bacterium RIFCSPLOWO2_01_FULL_53_9]|uniref:Alanine racemase n=1 Tax=Candidatus Uhrbacteria bacterium RIFCSPLOWO2_01_FULL_53_9 TaxID=1802403 RepID=A0A1F7UY22_9BACT|nr:MAG: alanine racemase [Candidatus Uhrbacteria bacterium RIFCSPLOWO2_01_FULL_53_9]
MKPSWIEIHEDAVRHNYLCLREQLGKGPKLMAVVKANAYGHDLRKFGKLVQSLGVDWMGVSTIDEALVLRSDGVTTPILLLTGSHDVDVFYEAARVGVSVTVSTAEGLETLRTLSPDVIRRQRIHLKIDTGMHRQGFLFQDIPWLAEYLKELRISSKVIEGVFTHFASAEDPKQTDETHLQIAQFHSAVHLIQSAGFRPLVHAAATAGAMIFPEARYDLVRVGAGLYGIWPSQATREAFEKVIPLKPACSWKTVVNEVKHLRQGSLVGYDLTATLQRDSVVALCPVGYWHGYRRTLSNIGAVLVRGVRVPIVGRISMGMTAIDVTDVPGVCVGQEVVLLGKERDGDEISLDEFAQWCGSINKDVVSTIHPSLERIYR